ncbi:MAG TPA: hypothetical protein VF192_16415 [Longimicrobiales bacterium]
MILPNVRASFGRAEATYVLGLLTRGDSEARAREEDRLREEGFDAILDDPRTLNAVMTAGGPTSAAPAPLVFYLLVRHALLENGILDRLIADYLASLLLEFGRAGRAQRIDASSEEQYDYLADIVQALGSASGRRAFLLRAHLGNMALWLSGLFPDYITARVHRRGAPGIEYYEEMGATGYALAADTADAESYGLDGLYRSCARSFPALRTALNTMSDRYFFPVASEPIDRLLRQVADRFRVRSQAH